MDRYDFLFSAVYVACALALIMNGLLLLSFMPLAMAFLVIRTALYRGHLMEVLDAFDIAMAGLREMGNALLEHRPMLAKAISRRTRLGVESAIGRETDDEAGGPGGPLKPGHQGASA